MPESDTSLLRRLIALRHVPAFATAELDELATLADNATEIELVAGEEIVAAGEPVPHMHLVLAGRIEMAGEPDAHAWGPYEVFGTLEVLSGRPARRAAVAMAATRTLRLSAVELADLLEDNLGILASTLRQLARTVVAMPPHPPGPPAEVPTAPQLGLVERLILFRQQPLLAGGKLQALTMLAQVSAERTWPAGAVIAAAGSLTSEALFILEGTVKDGDTGHAGRGATLGLVETIAATKHATALVAATPVRALTSSVDALFDVLEDHTSLGLTMLEGLAKRLLDDGARA